MTNNDSAKDLAVQVLAVLDLQREYFKSRDTGVLNRCREAESNLRKRCKEIVSDVPAVPGLFDLVNQ